MYAVKGNGGPEMIDYCLSQGLTIDQTDTVSLSSTKYIYMLHHPYVVWMDCFVSYNGWTEICQCGLFTFQRNQRTSR